MTLNLSTDNPPRSLLRRLSPVSKVVCCVVFIVCVVAVPPSGLPRLLWLAGIVLSLWMAARISLVTLANRLALALPFVLIAAFSIPFLDHGGRQIAMLPGGLVISEAGLMIFQAVVVKAAVCIAALSLLGETTPPEELLAALRQLRFPGLLVTILSLTVRYLLILRDEARRMMQARNARGPGRGLLRRANIAGAMVGSLFLRSYERAERVGQAMAARGFDGTLPVVTRNHFAWRDTIVALLFVAATATLTLW